MDAIKSPPSHPPNLTHSLLDRRVNRYSIFLLILQYRDLFPNSHAPQPCPIHSTNKITLHHHTPPQPQPTHSPHPRTPKSPSPESASSLSKNSTPSVPPQPYDEHSSCEPAARDSALLPEQRSLGLNAQAQPARRVLSSRERANANRWRVGSRWRLVLVSLRRLRRLCRPSLHWQELRAWTLGFGVGYGWWT